MSKKILVVDDDPGLARLIVKTLRREGWESSSVQSGTETITSIQDSRPDLLLLDLNLPDMSGDKVIELLAARNLQVPFIVITGQGDERVAVQMMKKGALDYLVKDADFLEIMPTMVRRAVEQFERDAKLTQTEAALKRELGFTRAVLETLGALVLVLDPDGKIQKWNRACEETTGYTSAEVLGRSILEFIEPDEEKGVNKVLERLQKGEKLIEFENHLRTRTAGRRLIAWSNTSLKNSTGGIQHIIATGIDITERKELEREIIEISNREKLRIGQDLHDGICQELSAIELMSQVLEQKLSNKAPTEAALADKIAKNVRQAVVNTKNVVRGLSPVVLEASGLVFSLEELCEIVSRLYSVECSFKCSEPVAIKDNNAAIHLYRIAQEACTNAIKHGHATRIAVQLRGLDKEHLQLEVVNNGTPFPPALENAKGMGLRIMKYRARMIGATIEFENEREKGPRVVCTFSRNL